MVDVTGSKRVKTSNGEIYQSVLVRVCDKDHMGRPLLLRVIQPGESVELSEDVSANEFTSMLGNIKVFADG